MKKKNVHARNEVLYTMSKATDKNCRARSTADRYVTLVNASVTIPLT